MKEFNGIERPAYTPDYFTELTTDEVFVFRSNLVCIHGDGAAYVASDMATKRFFDTLNKLERKLNVTA